MDHQVKDHVKFKSPILSRSNSGDVFEPSSSNAKQRATLVEWLNIILPDLNLPINASDEELRGYLVDGTILCRLIDKLKPNSVTQINGSTHSPHSRSENVKKYLSAVDEMGLPRFRASELEKGSMKIVVECLLTLQTHFTTSFGGSNGVDATKRWKPKGERLGREDLSRSLSFSSPNSEERRRVKLSDPKLHRSPTMAMADPSAALINHVGHKFHEVFQLKHVSYTDLSPGKLSEMMKSNSLDNAPTQSLLSVVNSILDESIERKNGEIPHRVACLLRKVVQEIERRISTQAEHLRTQNNLFKAREDKYQSRIRVLEALATGTGEETKIVMDQLQHIKSEKSQIERKKVELLTSVLQSENKIEERKKVEPLSENNKIEERKKVGPLTSTPQSETNKIEEVKKVEPLTSTLQSENKKIEEREKLEPLTSTPQSENNELEERKKIEEKVAMKLMEEKENHNKEITTLKQELEIARKQYEQKCLEERKIVEPLTSTVQSENNEIEERKKIEEQIALKLINEKENHNKEIAALKEDLEIARKQYEQKCLEERKIVEPLTSTVQSENNEIEEKKKIEEQIALKLIQEKDNHDKEIAALKQELEIARKRYEQKCFEMETEYTGSNQELEQRLKDLGNLLAESRNKVKALEVSSESHSHLLTEERNRVKELEESTESTSNLLTESRNKVKALEASSESMSQQWNKKNQLYRKLTEFQLGALRELRAASQTIQQEIVGIQKKYSEDFGHLGTRMIALEEAAKQYYSLLAENQKLHNELQEVKGNIRVYCRVRPFLPGQSAKQTIVEYIGENGEIVVINPSKQGKEGRRSFKFNKVYGPTATQAEVFVDTQPLVQSVLDGFNVCIFAYGQTGSGKTYTMTGPDGATEKDWGVNYRALNDLFRISQLRKNTFKYEISVQMMEIYNEQVRDLLSNDGAPKKLGIVSAFQSNGLAVPEASIQPVNSPVDVLKLMDIGLKNRARSSTALNERSSRSHSIVTIHARAMDLKTGSSSRASLHLVDLAGSERVDRSEVTGDRLKEAQHINKSLAALGDVISALAQKSSHVPYRNSKLTQVLQSSLGGHAKTLMFVQLNPDISSCSESVSTLKFAERVSGVELGAAKSSKDGRDVRELMEQVASLKDTIAKKDEEIERLQLIKDQN